MTCSVVEKWSRWLCVGILFSASASAWADREYYVESPSTTERSLAEAQLEDLPSLADGLQPRVIRRFQVGEGWAYVIRVDSLEQAQAHDVAEALQQGSQTGIVYRRIGSRTVRVMEEPRNLDIPEPLHETSEAPAEDLLRSVPLDAPATLSETENLSPPPPPPAAADLAEDDEAGFQPRLRSAESILNRAIRAHGGEAGGAQQIDGAGSVYFVYERTVATETGTLLVHHDFTRWGEGLRLGVHILQGDGTDSLAVVDRSGEAWVVVEGQKTARNAERTSAVLRTFGPAEILGISMHLPEKVRLDDRLGTMTLSGNEASPGGERVILRAPEGSGRGLEEVAFDAAQAWLVSATWSSLKGTIRMAFENYTVTPNGLVYPARMTVWRDGDLTERIIVQQLKLNQPVDQSLFEVPDHTSPK